MNDNLSQSRAILLIGLALHKLGWQHFSGVCFSPKIIGIKDKGLSGSSMTAVSALSFWIDSQLEKEEIAYSRISQHEDDALWGVYLADGTWEEFNKKMEEFLNQAP